MTKDYASDLWGVLNKLRGSIEVTEYKNYLLPFMYYCYISKKIQQLMDEELANDELTYADAWDYQDDTTGEYEYREDLEQIQREKYGVVIPPEYLANSIRIYSQQNINLYGASIFIDKFKEAVDAFEENCSISFRGTMSILNLDSPVLGEDPDDAGMLAAQLFMQSFKLIETIFKDGTVENTGDTLGGIYEQLLGYFASSAGKKGGEFFTPKEMSKLTAKLATHDMQNAKAMSDPTCGSGSLLLQAAKEIEDKGGIVGYLYGQEKNSITSRLARMNMAIHEVNAEDFDIECCDTLALDRLTETKFDVTVANPPYSIEWDNGEYRNNDDRFAGYGALATAKTADLAFVQHIVSHMADNGRAAILLPHGVLFRGNAEQKIRETLIKNYNIIDAIVGLPANCFYGTGIAVCCLVLRKDRNGDSNNICFIDASKYFTKVGNKNTITDEDIDRIVTAYSNRENIDHFCSIVNVEEVAKNEYNLNIPLYVEAEKETVEHDLTELFKEYTELEKKSESLKACINKQLEGFGINERFELLGEVSSEVEEAAEATSTEAPQEVEKAEEIEI